jgi:hypothetical protein
MDLALREQRILLTEDKDFGQLVYASHSSPAELSLSATRPMHEELCRKLW